MRCRQKRFKRYQFFNTLDGQREKILGLNFRGLAFADPQIRNYRNSDFCILTIADTLRAELKFGEYKTKGGGKYRGICCQWERFSLWNSILDAIQWLRGFYPLIEVYIGNPSLINSDG